jgi:hypothetical protein
VFFSGTPYLIFRHSVILYLLTYLDHIYLFNQTLILFNRTKIWQFIMVWGLKLTTHIHLVSRLRMRGNVPPLPQCIFMAFCLV